MIVAAIWVAAYAAVGVLMARHEWRRQHWAPPAGRLNAACLVAVAWPMFVFMWTRDHHGPWALVETYSGIPGELDADVRVVARFFTEAGAYRAADDARVVLDAPTLTTTALWVRRSNEAARWYGISESTVFDDESGRHG